MDFQESVWKTIYRKVNFKEFIRIFTETDLPKSNKMDLRENDLPESQIEWIYQKKTKMDLPESQLKWTYGRVSKNHWQENT